MRKNNAVHDDARECNLLQYAIDQYNVHVTRIVRHLVGAGHDALLSLV